MIPSAPSRFAFAFAAFLMAASPAVALDAASLKLSDDFETGDFAPAGGLYYKKNAEQGAGKAEFQSRDIRHGKSALALSVEAQCKAGDSQCSERAEVWEKPGVLAPYDAGLWYAFSMKLAEPVPSDDHRYVMAQWKREIMKGAEGDYSPFLALRLIKGKLAVTIETGPVASTPAHRGRCRTGAALVNTKLDPDQTRALVAMEAAGGRAERRGFPECSDALKVIHRGASLPAAGSGWIDFVFNVRPGPRGDGHVEIFANGGWVATISGAIGHEGKGLGPNQYFKFGPYRAGHAGVWTVLYDDFRRGPDCKDVAGPEVCARAGVGG